MWLHDFCELESKFSGAQDVRARTRINRMSFQKKCILRKRSSSLVACHHFIVDLVRPGLFCESNTYQNVISMYWIPNHNRGMNSSIQKECNTLCALPIYQYARVTLKRMMPKRQEINGNRSRCGTILDVVRDISGNTVAHFARQPV